MFGSTSVHASLLRLGASFGINITKETEVISANVNNWYGLDQLDGIGYDDVLNISYTLYFMDNSHQKQILCHRENMTMIVGDDDRFCDTFHTILMQMRQGEKSVYKVTADATADEHVLLTVYVAPDELKQYPFNNNSRQAPEGKDTFYQIHVHQITKPKRVEPTDYSQRLQVALKYKNDGNILFGASRISGAIVKYMHSIEWADIDLPTAPNPSHSEFSGLLTEKHKLISACNNNLSLIYLRYKKWDSAIRHADKVLEIDANNKKAMMRKNKALANKENIVNGFRNYKWKQDKIWNTFLSVLEYPAQFDQEQTKQYLFKKRKKYYKENIDVDFDDEIAYETIYNVNECEQKEKERNIEAEEEDEKTELAPQNTKEEEKIEANVQDDDHHADACQNGPKQQFYKFLEDTRLTEYFDQFEEANVSDIRDVEFFDADTLSDIKFRNKLHMKKLLKEAEKLKVKMNEFVQLLRENHVSSQHKLLFNNLGIVTVDILCNQIKEKKHLQQKCNITNVPQQDMIWRMIERQWNPNQYGEDRKDNQVDHNPDQGDEGAKAETAYI
eukprot:529992_1